MAAKFTGKEYALTGSAVTLTTALGLTSQIFFSHGTIRTARANAGSVYIGKSDVTTGANRLGYLDAGEAFEIELESCYIGSDEVFIVGTASDIIHIAVVI